MNRKIRKKMHIVLIFTVISLLAQYFSAPIFALDSNAAVLARTFASGSDQLIKGLSARADQLLNNTINFTTNVAKSCFSLVERQAGLTENDLGYQAIKNRSLGYLGMSFEAARETKGLAELAFSSAVNAKTRPIQLLNLVYEIKQDPQKALQNELNNVKRLANWGLNGLASTANAMLNPQQVLAGLKQSYRDLNAAIKDDPIKQGELSFKIFAFMGTLSLGGSGTAKTAVKATEQVSKGSALTVPFLKQPLPVASSIPKSTSRLATGSQIKMAPMKKTPSVISASAVPGSKAASSSAVQFNHIEGLPYALLKNKYYVGETINGVKVTAKNGNVIRLENGVVLFENTFTNEKVVHVMKLDLQKGSDNLWYLPSGEKADGIYTFVIDMNNKLIVAPGNVHHSWLVDGAPVRYAGDFHYRDGQFIKWTHRSGHYIPSELGYLPKVAAGVDSVEKILKSFLRGE